MAGRGQPLCADCRRILQRAGRDLITASGVRVWAPMGYAGPARELVRALKFRGATALATWMAAQMVANAPDGLLGVPVSRPAGARAGEPVLVPVPLHRRRLRKRGFNQAALIATALAQRTGLEVCDCLRRTGAPTTQVGRAREERRSGPAGAIEVAVEVPERVLLVDDVVTTGATLAACSAALAEAGVQRIEGIAFARTMGR